MVLGQISATGSKCDALDKQVDECLKNAGDKPEVCDDKLTAFFDCLYEEA